ncbi:MAG: hypothetical protein AAF193_10545, partial [Bacteroidota bacterium]
MPTFVQVACNNIPDMPEPEVSDNCDEQVAVTLNESIIGSGCEFTIIRTWIASDDCGNTSIFSQSINVIDEASPVFVDAPAEQTVSCSLLEGYPYPTVLDDCDATVNITFEDEVLGSGCMYDVMRTYTATDACGNQAVASTLFHVVDDVPPVINGVPANTFVNCSTIPNPSDIEVFDECSTVEWEVNDFTIGGDPCSYIINRSYQAMDACGNTTGVTQLIYVSDESAPELTLSGNEVLIGCGALFPEPEVPNVSDDCDSNPNLSNVILEEETACGTNRRIIWTATDACGNTSTIEQIQRREDLTPPTIITVLEAVNTTCDAIPDPITLDVMDECSAVTTFHEDQVIIGGCPYEVRRTYTAVDACGNASELVQSIWVMDVQPPTFSEYPEDLTVSCDEVPEAPQV